MLRIYNTLSRTIEEFKPLNNNQVGVYSCGPTVYDYQHIGHMRRYVGDDILVRVLKLNKYNVKHVMNITDVGHLVSDSDTGEDKMEKGAKKFGMSVWDIAKKFEQQFFDSEKLLNIKKPDVVIRATDAIQDQIDLISILEEKGFTYKTEDGIYFDTSKFPDYFNLSGQDPKQLKAGARIAMSADKKNISDFALWKFSYSNGRSFDSSQDDSAMRRRMEWDSPWGVGFPGWHIECSAMSMKNLGPTFDIHTGGIDHISIHHTNEIAQSQAATGRKFVNYWVHHNFLTIENEKMSKSLSNFYTVEDIVKKGFDPLALRYLYLQTHYRQEMNFTFEALTAAQTAFKRLQKETLSLKEEKNDNAFIISDFENKFLDAVNDDLNIPKALSVIWDLLKSENPKAEKLATILEFDKVLGLDLNNIKEVKEIIPENILKMVEEREELRKQKRFHLADQIRNKVKKLGYEILDKEKGNPVIKKIH